VLIAFTIFLAFSIGAGFAQTLQQLIVCRAFQGMGGAGLYALSIILITEISTPENTAVLAGLIGATVAMSGVLGPIVGGLLTHYASWRWVFWIK
jgi:MFS family permease